MDHIVDSNGVELFDLAQRFDLPDFVKNAAIDREAITSLPSSSFADSAARLFPCHTRADTCLSYLYFLKHANDVPDARRATVFNRLQQFARDWAIYAECQQLKTAHEKQASRGLDTLADDAFMILEEVNGEIYRALPVTDTPSLKQAQAHLVEYRDRYPADWRRRAAERMLVKANELSQEPAAYVQKAANAIPSPSVDVAAAITSRLHLVPTTRRSEPEYVGMLKLARAIAEQPGFVRRPDAVTSTLDAFDRHFDLVRLYARSLPTPEEVVYGAVLAKTASDVTNSLIRLTTNNVYTKSALFRHGIEPYRILGDEFISCISDGELELDREKAARIIPTLPKDDAELLERALRAVGEKPVAATFKAAGLEDCETWSSADWRRAAELVSV